MDAAKKINLCKTACDLRMGIIQEVYNAHSGHPGGSLSIADIMSYLYFEKMNIRPQEPKWENRDRLVLSKGHCAPALYAALALRGFFSTEEWNKLRHTDALLQGHPDMKHIAGVDMTTGSLGQGVSAACGMAKAGKIQNLPYRVYAILGDGEIQEGQVWEAAMFAAHQKLDNLCVVVDNNNLQIDGPITDVCSPYPIDEKFKAFGFHVICIDGHDFDQIEGAFDQMLNIKGKPTAIIAKTVKGKNVSFMENQVKWHGAAPNKEEYELAIAELTKIKNELSGRELK